MPQVRKKSARPVSSGWSRGKDVRVRGSALLRAGATSMEDGWTSGMKESDVAPQRKTRSINGKRGWQRGATLSSIESLKADLMLPERSIERPKSSIRLGESHSRPVLRWRPSKHDQSVPHLRASSSGSESDSESTGSSESAASTVVSGEVTPREEGMTPRQILNPVVQRHKLPSPPKLSSPSVKFEGRASAPAYGVDSMMSPATLEHYKGPTPWHGQGTARSFFAEENSESPKKQQPLPPKRRLRRDVAERINKMFMPKVGIRRDRPSNQRRSRRGSTVSVVAEEMAKERRKSVLQLAAALVDDLRHKRKGADKPKHDHERRGSAVGGAPSRRRDSITSQRRGSIPGSRRASVVDLAGNPLTSPSRRPSIVSGRSIHTDSTEDSDDHSHAAAGGGGSSLDDRDLHRAQDVARIHGNLLFGSDASAPDRSYLRSLMKSTGFSRRDLYAMNMEFKAMCSMARRPTGIDRETFCRISPLLSMEDHDFSDRVYSLLDEDGSESIEWDEYITAASKLLFGTTRQRAMFLFDVYDDDAGGSIDVDELYGYLVASMWLKDDELTPVFRDALRDFTVRVLAEVDPHHKGELTREKVVEFITNHPNIKDVGSIFGRGFVSKSSSSSIHETLNINKEHEALAREYDRLQRVQQALEAAPQLQPPKE